MIGPALFDHLTGDTDVAALIVPRGVYPHVIPQQAGTVAKIPCVLYEIQSEVRERTYCGTSLLFATRVAISSVAKSFQAAQEVAAAVRRSLVDFAGTMGSTGHTVDVRDVSLIDAFSIDDPEPGFYRVRQTYNFWLVED